MARYVSLRCCLLHALWGLLVVTPAAARGDGDRDRIDVAQSSPQPAAQAETPLGVEHPALEGSGAVASAPGASSAALPDAPVAMDWLRALEAQLSEGVPLDDDVTAALLDVVRHHPVASVRAAATGVLAWLPPSVGGATLISAARDDVDGRVRAQALAGLAPLSSRAPEPLRQVLIEAISAGLRDPVTEVFCAAAEALGAADAAAAARLLPALADGGDRGRYECLRRLTPLPELPLYLPSDAANLPIAEVAPMDTAPLEESPLEAAPPAVEPTFVAVAAGFGVVAGGLLPGMFLIPRDTLLYRGDHSVRFREEVSLWVSGATGVLGAAALGGAAAAVQGMAGPVTEGEGTALLLATTAGAVALGGGGLAAGFDGTVTSALWLSGASTALLGGTALSVFAPPAREGAGTALALGSQAALLAGLLGVAAFPPSEAGTSAGLSQLQRPLGLASLAGGGTALAAIALGRWYPMPPQRVGWASAIATAAATGASALSWLCLPLDPATRERAAAAAGAGAQVIAAGAALLWLPGEEAL